MWQPLQMPPLVLLICHFIHKDPRNLSLWAFFTVASFKSSLPLLIGRKNSGYCCCFENWPSLYDCFWLHSLVCLFWPLWYWYRLVIIFFVSSPWVQSINVFTSVDCHGQIKMPMKLDYVALINIGDQLYGVILIIYHVYSLQNGCHILLIWNMAFQNVITYYSRTSPYPNTSVVSVLVVWISETHYVCMQSFDQLYPNKAYISYK